MNKPYYSLETHGYMRYQNDRLAEYLFSILPLDSLLKFENAVELGAGMGRFSAPIINHFKNVTLVEPEPAYAEALRRKFTSSKLSVVESTAAVFLRSAVLQSSAIFAFHLMHHLNRASRTEIYSAIRASKSAALFVEPNPFNPLILIQVLCHPDMKFSEERQYLTLTRGVYGKELGSAGLKLLHHGYILFLPPFCMNFLLQKFNRGKIIWTEKLNFILPFLSSYQVVLCE